MDAKIMKEIHDIRVMLKDIQDNMKYFKAFMQEKQNLEINHEASETLETNLRSEAEQESAGKRAEKNREKELPIKI